MTTKTDKETQAKSFDVGDYLPERDKDLDEKEIDLSFGLDDDGEELEGGDDEGLDDAGDPDGADASGKDEDAGKDDSDDDDAGEAAEADAGKPAADKKAEGKTAADEGTKKPIMVPKSRLDSVLAKNRELAEELARTKAANKVEPKADDGKTAAFDFDAKEIEYQNAVLEGEATKAAQIRREIKAAERAEILAEVQVKGSETSTKQQSERAILEATASIEREFPMLNSTSKEYNEDAANEMIAIYAGHVSQGKEPIDALNKALETVVKLYDLTAPDEKPAAKKDTGVRDKLVAAKKQPPKQPAKQEGAKDDDGGIDVANMSEEEFDALPESVRARLRGDVI